MISLIIILSLIYITQVAVVLHELHDGDIYCKSDLYWRLVPIVPSAIWMGGNLKQVYKNYRNLP